MDCGDKRRWLGSAVAWFESTADLALDAGKETLVTVGHHSAGERGRPGRQPVQRAVGECDGLPGIRETRGAHSNS